LKSLAEYHSKGTRRSSSCKTCRNKEKKSYRKRLKIQKQKLEEERKKALKKQPCKFALKLHGELCEESQHDFVEAYSSYFEEMAA